MPSAGCQGIEYKKQTKINIMKLLNKGIISASVLTAFLAVSCANEAPWSSSDKADGRILLNLQTDGSILTGTRADDVSPLVPNSAEFSIILKSTDGSYNNSWKTMDAFNKEDGFPMGSYNISAVFGDMETEGFSNPYFQGESSVSVLKGESSNVNITATLKNAMLSVRYTDEFSRFYTGYSTTSTTEGHDPVVFVQGERRPAYISTGEVNLKLTLTNSANQTVTVSPAKFKAEAQKHYIVTFGVEGNIDLGEATLSIEWSEELVSEEKKISLSEELFTTPAPSISLQGYDKENETLFEGLEYDINPEFHVLIFGGLEQATLTIKAEDGGVLPACGGSIDLVNADASTQALLKASGIECAGFFGNASDMAVINFKELIRRLAPGTYTITLDDVEDSFFRHFAEDNKVELKVKITGLEYNFLSYVKPDFNSDEVIVVVEANSEIIKDQLVFSANDGSDLNVLNVECISEEKPENPTSNLDHVYTYKLKLGNKIDNCQINVQTGVPNKVIHAVDIDVVMPEFTVERDAFAKRVRMRLAADTDEAVKSLVLEKGVIYNGNQSTSINVSDVYDVSTGMITLTGLNPNNSYNYAINLGKTLYSGYDNNAQFTTEVAADVPNGDFETEPCPQNLTTKGSIQVGGQWRAGAITYTIKSSIDRNVASGWANLNPKTCNPNAANKNSWFIVPSTFVETIDDVNVNIIRSVGYHENGNTPLSTGSFSNTKYYCTNTPSELRRSVGELFLGTYNFNNNTDNRTDGVEFGSRPSKISFDYTYTALENEIGEFQITLIDTDNSPIISQTIALTPVVSSVTKKLDFNYPFGKKVKSLYISFKSSTNDSPAINIPKNDELFEGYSGMFSLPVTPYILYNDPNVYKAVALGSELRISNVHFEY